MGDLDLTEFWGNDDLQKLAREADFDAERMASSMLEELSDVEREWLDEGEEAEDYMEDIQELAEKVCEHSYNESGSYQDEASQDEDEDSPSEDEEASLDEDEAAVLHRLLERKGPDAVLREVKAQQEEFDGAELEWKWHLEDEHGNTGWVGQLEQGTKRSAGYEFFESDDEDEDYDEDEEEDEPPVKRRCYPVMYEHERADYVRWRGGR